MAKTRTLWKQTALVRLFGIAKIPLIWFCSPKVKVLSEARIEVVLPLKRRTRNHLGGMYFGSQAVGADMAAGLLAFKIMRDNNLAINLIFKDFKAEFLKRAEDDMLFTCTDGDKIITAMQQASESGERVSFPVEVVGTVPGKFGSEPVSRFTLTMSLKQRG
jgi:hypothetical protein